MGLGYVEVVAMMEQMGRYLLCAPFFSTVCLAANALLLAGNEEQKAQWLGQLCEGTDRYAGLQRRRQRLGRRGCDRDLAT